MMTLSIDTRTVTRGWGERVYIWAGKDMCAHHGSLGLAVMRAGLAIGFIVLSFQQQSYIGASVAWYLHPYCILHDFTFARLSDQSVDSDPIISRSDTHINQKKL